MAETPLFGGDRLQMRAPTLDKCQGVKKCGIWISRKNVLTL